MQSLRLSYISVRFASESGCYSGINSIIARTVLCIVYSYLSRTVLELRTVFRYFHIHNRITAKMLKFQVCCGCQLRQWTYWITLLTREATVSLLQIILLVRRCGFDVSFCFQTLAFHVGGQLLDVLSTISAFLANISGH